jgi:uncharacterized membrane protein YgcG
VEDSCGWRAAVLGPILAGAVLALAMLAPRASAAGPPYPEPVRDQAVYDYADVLSPEIERRLEATIDGIEERVGAEIVVYTQIKPASDTEEAAEADALALIDQWGIGRRGFDDGLVILYDLDESHCHGQVQLYAGPGYAATFLDNAERQRIYEEEMLPRLRDCDIEGATLVAMDRIDANATPEHAQTLERARILDAALGLIAAPIILVLLVGWVLLDWLRYGRDPQYLDDPSILMPAPPPEMTAATGALVVEGRTTRRALTTAMLDLASRGEISFRDESALMSKKVGVQVLPPAAQDDPDVFRNRRKPLSAAEEDALGELKSLAGDEGESYIEPEELLKFGSHVNDFNEKLEQHAVAKGWFRERPGRSITRWGIRGGLEIAGAIVAFIAAINIPSAGLILSALALLVAGIVTLIVAYWMPARTMAGAIVYAMLSAYRRTLQKTLEQARSMRQVVESRVVPWLETPDQAVVWGVALGLHEEIEGVLRRSLEDLREGRATAQQAWLPVWYGSGLAASQQAGPSGWGGVAPGLMSASAIPSVGGMMAALGTIGNTPSSSGSGGGGFGGGGGGGGGGGAGGGF